MIEIERFRLAGGVSDEDFLVADRRVQTEFIPNHPGFARRTTAQGADGEWVVVTLWFSEEEADASAALGVGDSVARSFRDLIDDASYERTRWHELPG